MPVNPHTSRSTVGEQPAVDGRGHAVDVGVGVHHRTRPCERDGRLERREDHVHQLAAAHRDRPVVAGRAGGGVAGEVLQGGDHPGALQAAHVGAAGDGDEVGVLAHGLLDPAPPVVAHDVDDRRQTLLHPDRGHVAADRGGHPLDEVGVEGGAPGDGRGVDGGAVGGEAREALLVDDRRDAQARAVDHRALLAHQLGRALRGRERAAAVDAGEVAEPVAARLGERRGRARGEHVLHRRDVLVGRSGARWTSRCPPSGCRAGPPSPRASSPPTAARRAQRPDAPGPAKVPRGYLRNFSGPTFWENCCRIEMNRQCLDAV